MIIRSSIAALGLALAATPAVALDLAPTQSLTDGISNDVTLVDIDGDTDLDLIVAQASGDDEVWLNDGTGMLSDSGNALSATGTTRRVLVADAEDDSDSDVLVAGATAQLYTNDGTGTLSAGASIDPSGIVEDWTFADVDGDDLPDAVVLLDGSGIGADSFKVFYGTVDGFSAGDTGTEHDLTADANCDEVAAGDLDGSPGAELVFGCDPYTSNSTEYAGGILVWRYVNQSSQLEADQSHLDTDWDVDALAIADFTADGSAEVVSTHFNSATPVSVTGNTHGIWINDGTGTLSAGSADFGGQGVAAADMDDDGDMDLVVVDGGSSDFYAGDGQGGFASGESIETCNAYATSVALGDLDADGEMDAVIGSSINFSSDEPNDLVLIEGGTNEVCPDSGGGTAPAPGDGDDDGGATPPSSGGDGGGGGGALGGGLLVALGLGWLRSRRRG